MRIRLRLNPERRDPLKRELTDLGVEITDDTDLILTEENFRMLLIMHCRQAVY